MRIRERTPGPVQIWHAECGQWHEVGSRITRCEWTGDLFEMVDEDHLSTIRSLSEIERTRKKLHRS